MFALHFPGRRARTTFCTRNPTISKRRIARSDGRTVRWTRIYSETAAPFRVLCSAVSTRFLSPAPALPLPPYSRLEARLAELDTLVSDPKLYDDSARAGKIVKERAKVESKLEAVKGLASELQTWREMHGEMDVGR